MCDMLRVGALLVAAVCLAVSRCAASVELCGPLYLDPHTFGGSQADVEPRSALCNATHLRVVGDDYDMNYAKGWRPLLDMEWFGVLPKCRQVAIGVSINQEAEGGIRGNKNSVGISLNSNYSYWGDPEEPTDGGLNQNFTERLRYAGKNSHWPGMWVMVNKRTNKLWYAHPGMEPISFDLPDSFDGKDLYPHVQVWNSKSLEILHDKPLMSHSCTKSLFINERSFNGSGLLGDNPEILKVSNSSAEDLGVVKLGGVLMDGQWIGGIAKSGARPGIGVSTIPYRLKEYFPEPTGNPKYNFLLHDSFWSFSNGTLDLDFNTEVALYIKVDYAASQLSYVAYYNGEDSEPFEKGAVDLPNATRYKPLFPVFMVAKGHEIKIETEDVPEDSAGDVA